jgi:hypothetical protein
MIAGGTSTRVTVSGTTVPTASEKFTLLTDGTFTLVKVCLMRVVCWLVRFTLAVALDDELELAPDVEVEPLPVCPPVCCC